MSLDEEIYIVEVTDSENYWPSRACEGWRDGRVWAWADKELSQGSVDKDWRVVAWAANRAQGAEHREQLVHISAGHYDIRHRQILAKQPSKGSLSSWQSRPT